MTRRSTAPRIAHIGRAASLPRSSTTTRARRRSSDTKSNATPPSSSTRTCDTTSNRPTPRNCRRRRTNSKSGAGKRWPCSTRSKAGRASGCSRPNATQREPRRTGGPRERRHGDHENAPPVARVSTGDPKRLPRNDPARATSPRNDPVEAALAIANERAAAVRDAALALYKQRLPRLFEDEFILLPLLVAWLALQSCPAACLRLAGVVAVAAGERRLAAAVARRDLRDVRCIPRARRQSARPVSSRPATARSKRTPAIDAASAAAQERARREAQDLVSQRDQELAVGPAKARRDARGKEPLERRRD